MSDKPISDLRRRMIADMTVRSFSDKTQHDYIRHIETFARFLGRSPDTATGDDIRRFQLAQVEQGAQPPKMNTQASALRFFFTIHQASFSVTCPMRPQSLCQTILAIPQAFGALRPQPRQVGAHCSPSLHRQFAYIAFSPSV